MESHPRRPSRAPSTSAAVHADPKAQPRARPGARRPTIGLAAAACAALSLASSGAGAGDAPPKKAAPATAPKAPASDAPKLNIPFTKYKLDNGLVVVLHEDHALPLVSVNLSVKVGSRFEEARRTGFAHLFEHLMFMGTRRAPPKMFDAWMEAEGGWNNAFTSEDRTGYYDVGPAHVLPLLLWLEGDRFATLADEMNQDKLNAQRDVVRNERRERTENTPYGKVRLRLPELLFPEGHPYHHPVIGSHEDLQAATVDDVKSFFKRWYVPNNTSLVVAGDFDAEKVKADIARYFGPIPSVAVPEVKAAAPAKLTRVVRETLTDDVKLPKVVMGWHSPSRYTQEDADLDLLATILMEGKASRLYKALVYDRPLAQEVEAYQDSGDLSSQFVIEAVAQPKVTLDELEKAIDAELKKLTEKPVSESELARAKNQFETAFVMRLESVVGRGSMLSEYEATHGDPGFAEKDLARYRAVTPESLLKTAKSAIDLGARVIIRVVPNEEEAKKPDEKSGAKDAPKGGAQ